MFTYWEGELEGIFYDSKETRQHNTGVLVFTLRDRTEKFVLLGGDVVTRGFQRARELLRDGPRCRLGVKAWPVVSQSGLWFVRDVEPQWGALADLELMLRLQCGTRYAIPVSDPVLARAIVTVLRNEMDRTGDSATIYTEVSKILETTTMKHSK